MEVKKKDNLPKEKVGTPKLVPPVNSTNKPIDKNDSPKTGDSSPIFFNGGLLIGMTLLLAATSRKRVK